MNTATEQQRDTAHAIWNSLDDLTLEVGNRFSDVHYYAVWGLCNAILNTKNRDEETYNSWMSKLYEVWGMVSNHYKK